MKCIVFVLSFFVFSNLSAQSQTKKALSISDFNEWNTIVGPQISNNGKYIAFELNPQKGDGNLVIIYNNDSDTIPRGNKVKIGSENDFAVFTIKQPEAKIRKAKKDKLEKNKMPKDSLGIFIFKEKQLKKFPRVKSFKIAEENAEWVTFLMEGEEEKKDSTETGKEKTGKKKSKQPGDDLVLFEIKSTDTLHFSNVTEYVVSKKYDAIYFVQQTKDSLDTHSSLKYFDTDSKIIKEIYKSEGWLKKIATSEDGSNYAFLASKDTTEEKVYALYSGSVGSNCELIVDSRTNGIPVSWSPSENGDIFFSQDNSKIYFGNAEVQKKEEEDSLLAEEKPVLDIWNWKDKKLQPQQLLEVEKEKKRTYLAVYHLAEKKFVQLADLNVKSVSSLQKGNGNIGLGIDEGSYQRASGWTGRGDRDYYLVDFVTGIKRMILKEKSYVRLSPTGKYVVWYDSADSSYYAQSTNINQLDIIPLTGMLPVNFYEETHDTPSDPEPYGIAGFSEDDRFVYIYDRYDIWRVDPSGEKVPVNMTYNFGRRNSTRLRYVKLDKDLDYIPENKTILLRAINERTMSGGFFGTKLNAVKNPELLVMDKYIFSTPVKAKEVDKLLWTKQNVSTFPDLWCSNLKFESTKKISQANGDQDNYIWPKVELVEWTSFSGKKLKGLFYTPENLDPSRKYPMVVYYYERSSESLYRHQHPYPSRSTINKTFYTSNGYLVFVPDIVYREGYPGKSAYESVVSGTQYLSQKYSFVDKEKIGLQGQSWGGYQTAWLITQTDMFAAAMAGAPVSNMTSAYGGIRWGTGLSRMFQYEHTQSRIGGTLWEKPLNYIENSPLFYAPNIKTPLLIMHNDKDGAVPWYQGIEMFVALRRLDKPVWLLNYNNEPHNLKGESWANRVDLSHRMFQFFNHFLKDEPAPEWMENGVPAIEKGKTLGY